MAQAKIGLKLLLDPTKAAHKWLQPSAIRTLYHGEHTTYVLQKHKNLILRHLEFQSPENPSSRGKHESLR